MALRECADDDDAANSLARVERDHILRVLDAAGWRVSGAKGAAAILGLKESTLRFRMTKLGIARKGR